MYKNGEKKTWLNSVFEDTIRKERVRKQLLN